MEINFHNRIVESILIHLIKKVLYISKVVLFRKGVWGITLFTPEKGFPHAADRSKSIFMPPPMEVLTPPHIEGVRPVDTAAKQKR